MDGMDEKKGNPERLAPRKPDKHSDIRDVREWI
jgi:hypothetical protein